MSCFLYENHRGSPTLTLLNVLGVLGVLNVLNVLDVLNMPMDASLACWALFGKFSVDFFAIRLVEEVVFSRKRQSNRKISYFSRSTNIWRLDGRPFNRVNERRDAITIPQRANLTWCAKVLRET